jgi:hypothetical protein
MPKMPALRLVLGLVIAIALFTSTLVLFGQFGMAITSYRTCLDITPDAMYLAAQVPESVETGVDQAFWPLSPICHWQYEHIKMSLPLLGWGYTYVFYSGLLVAGVAAITWISFEILHVRRRLRAASK